MNREQVRRTVTTHFYQSLADSDIEITAIPQKELQAVVNALADRVFATLDELATSEYEGETSASSVARPAANVSSPSSGSDEAEETLWRGRPYLTIGTRYELTTQRLRMIYGILGKRLEEIELVRVRDTEVKQHPGERALNIGDITIYSNDPSTPNFVLNNVTRPVEVREMIRKATMAEKERRGLHYREEM